MHTAQENQPTVKEVIVFNPHRARRVIMLLAASVGLMMTGYGIVMPVFAKRLGEFGSGVEALGFMTMAFAIAQFLLAPFMGTLADRFGRRPLILVGLAGVVAANLAYLLVESTGAYIAVRFFQGAITAGLLPAAMGVVADIVPEQQRAQWVGTLMGSYSAGFIFGPALGGFLYDHWGFAAPFSLSAGLALLGLLMALVMVPETRPAAVRQAAASRQRAAAPDSLLESLPRPLYILATLLLLDFMAVFAFAFIEPQMVFYFYDQLAYSTTQFGLIVGGYGLAMVFGQTMLGRLSDRFGRRPIMALGFGLNLLFYLSLVLFEQFSLVFAGAVIAGLGGALLSPALSAFYLDITAEQHRSRVMGLKESAAALGGVIGPLLVAVASYWLTAENIFLTSALVTLTAAGLTLVVLQAQRRAPSPIRPVPAGREVTSATGPASSPG
ncbi:MAG: MFS transporter [Anaerolineae bacterium]|nr:MFS transporter [Anaerolineae bacterium]